jgi:hypothetical protein
MSDSSIVIRAKAINEAPRPAARRRLVADQEEAVLPIVPLENYELADDRNDTVGAGDRSSRLFGVWRQSRARAEEVPDPTLGHDYRARCVVEVRG